MDIYILPFSGALAWVKSSVLNALLGRDAFSVSVLHGETKTEGIEEWKEVDAGGIYLIDTPGINEIDGEEREQLAHDVANRSDLLLFVVDSDLTEVELAALKTVADTQRPIILVVNKADQYNEEEILELRTIIRKRVKGIIAPANIVFSAASPSKQTVIYVDDEGNEKETLKENPGVTQDQNSSCRIFLDSLDRDSVMSDAKEEITRYLKTPSKSS
ncbi:tRNA modification GTPase MnmE [Nymphon striatum]|nr:tRNA modification GTPase MnmE [Nymphon striatum]